MGGYNRTISTDRGSPIAGLRLGAAIARLHYECGEPAVQSLWNGQVCCVGGWLVMTLVERRLAR